MVISRWIFGCCLNAALSSVPALVTAQPLPRITIVCEPLDVERTAEVEARIRAMLLTAQVTEPEVTIACTPARADVDVKAGTAAAHVEVSSERTDLEGRLLDGVDRALRELAEPKPEPARVDAAASATQPAHSTPSAPPPLAGSSAPGQPSRRPAALAPPGHPTARFEVSAVALLERWSAGNALSGSVGASYGKRTVHGGLSLGLASLTRSNAAFRSTELHAGLALTWEPLGTWGMRGSVGVGASLLTVTPNADYTPRSGTTATAAFAELAVTRPFWLASRWGFAPRLSARLFADRRSVTVNAEDALALAGVAPSLGLELLYRVE